MAVLGHSFAREYSFVAADLDREAIHSDTCLTLGRQLPPDSQAPATPLPTSATFGHQGQNPSQQGKRARAGRMVTTRLSKGSQWSAPNGQGPKWSISLARRSSTAERWRSGVIHDNRPGVESRPASARFRHAQPLRSQGKGRGQHEEKEAAIPSGFAVGSRRQPDPAMQPGGRGSVRRSAIAKGGVTRRAEKYSGSGRLRLVPGPPRMADSPKAESREIGDNKGFVM